MTDTRNPSTRQTPPSEIVYGVLEGTQELVFLPIDRARELAILHIALRTSRTWGEFRAILPSTVYAQVVEHLRENDAVDFATYAAEEGEGMSKARVRRDYQALPVGERLPQSKDPFNPEEIWGLSDGDWPGWPAQEMLEWMPSPVQQAFGTVEASVINGPYLAPDASQEDALVAALQTEGYCCRRDDTLVRLASGY